jgi:aspartate carbamoyltransferase
MDQIVIPDNLISVNNLDKNLINHIFETTRYFIKNELDKINKTIGLLFLESSSRTLMSFEASIKKLGGNSVSLNVNKSSINKGESIEDTLRCIASYVDLLVIRTYESNKLLEYSKLINIPIINAGDGSNEHPTQALIDLYTITQNFDNLDNLVITIMGDLKYSRTVHSLVKLLSIYNQSIKINYVSPEELSIPDNVKDNVNNNQSEFFGFDKLNNIINQSDILYLTRIQKERHGDDITLDNYIIDNKLIEDSKESLIILHPLPRNKELSTDLDNNPKSKYFEQMKNGLFVRMALLKIFLHNT